MKARNEVVKVREENIHIAEVAMHSERYDEMIEAMEKIAKAVKVEQLMERERNLLSLAYKNVMASREASRRIIASIEQKERRNSYKHQPLVVSTSRYQAKIRSEMSALCQRILNILDAWLIPNATNGESRVFFLKMKGDYHWRLLEFKRGGDWQAHTEFIIQTYKSARDIALTVLAPNHPIRLELALNISVFYHDVMNSLDKACSVAKEAIEAANLEIDTPGNRDCLQSKLRMELLVRNFTCWRSNIINMQEDIKVQCQR